MKRAPILVAALWLPSLLPVACRPRGSASSAEPATTLSLSGLLSEAPGASPSGDAGGFARALAPRPFVFPDDDGPHPAFRSEWWYFTGVLRVAAATPGAGRFGYEMTIFRQALAPAPAQRASAWATRDAFMGHFAITDVDGAGAGAGARFFAFERFARDGLGLAGARARPFAVWVDDWRMEGPADQPATLPIHLTARAEDGGALDLTVGAGGAGRGPIAEGDRGLSVKGPEPGEASHYYSRTRLPTRGRLTLPGARIFEVAGDSWMDREWSTGALGAAVRGWDWMGVQLSDGRDLTMYRLRDSEGRTTPESQVTLIGANGDARHWPADQFVVTVLDVWTSPHSGARYPVSVRLEIPRERLRLEVRPLWLDQELRLSVGYWEGAVSLAGDSAGAPIHGEGYLELTGYGGDQRQPGQLPRR
jgi:predicted secreted hydrolase